MTWKRKLLTDKYYTKLIPASEENLFEFNRDKEFFELLLDKKLDIKCPEINSSKLPKYQGLPG